MAHSRRAAAAAVKAGKQQCEHKMVQKFGVSMSCGDCWEEIKDTERLAAEMAKMEEALAEDSTGDDFLWSRAVTVGWLWDFAAKYHCWNWKTWEVQAFIIKPETEATRQRYADLPHVRATAGVGPADVFGSRE